MLEFFETPSKTIYGNPLNLNNEMKCKKHIFVFVFVWIPQSKSAVNEKI